MAKVFLLVSVLLVAAGSCYLRIICRILQFYSAVLSIGGQETNLIFCMRKEDECGLAVGPAREKWWKSKVKCKNSYRAIVAVVGSTLFASWGSAQNTGAANGTEFGDWRLACVAQAVNQTSCALVQRVIFSDTGELIAEVRLSRLVVGEEPRILMALQTPTNMRLPIRPAFQIVGTEDTIPLEWQTCGGEVCTAVRLLENEEVQSLVTAPSIIIGYQPIASDEPLNFQGSLDGISDGLSALAPD